MKLEVLVASQGPGGEVVSLEDALTGREIRQLTSGPRVNMHAYYDISPWSPDGRRIVYASHDPAAAGAQIWVMDADGANKRHVADSPDYSPHTAAAQKWSDDHTVVLPLGEGGMRLIDVDAGTEQEVHLPAGVLKVTADGRHGVGIDAREAGVVDMATGSYRQVLTVEHARALSPHQDLLEGEESILLNPRWSHDGRGLLISHRTLEKPQRLKTELGPVDVEGPILNEILLYDLDDDDVRRLARVNHHPTWLVDDTGVLYVGRDAVSGRQDLRVVDRKTGDIEVLFDREHVPAGHPLYHPRDPNLLVTDAFGGRYGYGIISIRLDTQEIELLATIPRDSVPSEDPLAHHADAPNWHCWSYPRWGHPYGIGWHPHPAWSPDGTQLLYIDPSPGVPQICLLDVSDLARTP